MDFDHILDQAVEMLQRRGRLTYRTLKRQFQLDDAGLEDLKEELLYSQPQVVDDEGRGLVWTGDALSAPSPAAASERPSVSVREPLSYTPSYLRGRWENHKEGHLRG